MIDPMIPVAVAATTVGGAILVVILSHVLQMHAHGKAQTQAKANQERVKAQVEESLELSRRNVENSDRLLRLTAQSISNQEEMIRLLREVAGRQNGSGEAAQAIQTAPARATANRTHVGG